MRNRLPLPTSTIKVISSLIDNNSNNLWIRNPLANCLRYICSYDYKEAITLLNLLEKDYPNLMNYSKHIKAISNAEKRYNFI